LEALCEQLVRDKTAISRRKGEYKQRWEFLESEIEKMINERQSYQQRFDGTIGYLNQQLSQMGEAIRPGTGQEEGRRCCEEHSTTLVGLIQRTGVKVNDWSRHEEIDRRKWEELTSAHMERVSAARPANPGELSIDQV
jgi:hypothetical protein